MLKIVEGPNKGAEIALPEGVAVTLGKSDDCDIVLADATLSDAALTLKAAPDGVTMDGEPLGPFVVAARGATAFAVGPADAPWGELKWPERETGNGESASAEAAADKRGTGSGEDEASPSDDSRRTSQAESAPPREKKTRHGCIGCLFWVVLLLVVLGALGWFFRRQVRPYVEKAKPYAERAKDCAERMISRVSSLSRESRASRDSGLAREPDRPTDSVAPLQDIILRYGLAQTNRAGRTALSGDFATRAERLTATAEAYAACPGIELDFSDVESLTAAAEDTFALIGERDLHVAAATNRVIVLSGTAANLRRALEALSADLPKLRDVECSRVNISRRGAEAPRVEVNVGHGGVTPTGDEKPRVFAPRRDRQPPTLPVCGILTTPYPCLVLKNGARVMQGAPLGEWTVARIDADSVTLTNSERSVTWNP